jgi:glycosyltransferase involved in cell wall biosynthesis
VTDRGGLRVSVALCTHNGAAFVEQQVRSILAQTLVPDEIVLSDDASTDATVALVTALVEPSPVALTVLENSPALGVTKNFEQAVRACSGDLIALCDQDDSWHPGKLAAAAALFAENSDLLLASSDADLVDGDGAPLGHSLFEALEIADADLDALNSGDAFAVLLRRNLVTGATTVFRRQLVDIAGDFPSAWVHDEWLASMAAAVGRVRMTRERQVDYRQHGANQIGAAKLSLRGKAGRLLEPRASRNARLEARARALVERLQLLGAAVPAPVLAGARGKLDHETLRNSLPANRLRRIAPVVREARSGGYGRYGRGRIDVLRDLVQSAS